MPAYGRREIVATDHIGVFHCISRCVRRAFLCGDDPVSGKNHDHRKEWIRDRLRELASVFAIEVCGYSVMSNHFRAVLRIRPDLAEAWSDGEIALRWLHLFPPRDETAGRPAEPAEHDLNMITSVPARVSELRTRLVSLSWFMFQRAETAEGGAVDRVEVRVVGFVAEISGLTVLLGGGGLKEADFDPRIG